MSWRKKIVDYYAKGLHKTVATSFREQKRLLAGHPVRTIVDAGAHVGSAAFAYRRLFPDSRIFCFEPFQASYDMLASNLNGQTNMVCTNAALSAENGTQQLFVNQSTAANSLLPTNAQVAKETQISATLTCGITTVETRKLDDFCAEQGVSHVDVLKLDVQGGELNVLRGAEEYLRRGGVSLIYSEVEFVQFYERQPLFHDISSYLQQYGYRFLNLFNVRRRNSQMLWGDAIFIGPTLRSHREGQEPENAQ